MPNVTTGDEFEICRGIKDKGKLTGEYEVLDTTKQIKDSSLANWEVLFLQFRDASSGEYSVYHSIPPLPFVVHITLKYNTSVFDLSCLAS